jgi:general secretion pathway protein L
MMTDFGSSALHPRMGRLADALSLFQRWWLEEFQALFSNRLGRWLLGSLRQTLQLRPTLDAVHLVLSCADENLDQSTQIGGADYSRHALDGFLGTHRLSLADIDVTLRLPFDDFFCRKLILPTAVISNLDEIVMRDMAKKTPFRSDDVYHHHLVELASQSDKIVVWQWIIKRKFIDDALSRLQLNIGEVAFVDAEDPSQQTPSPLIMLRRSRQDISWYRSSLRMLLLSAAILSVVAVGARLWRQQSTLDDLDARIASVRTKAQQVRAQVDSLEKKRAAIVRVRTEKDAIPGLLDVWEQTTAILPSHSWLTELQFSRPGGGNAAQQVSLIGFSEAAASLVGLFEKSSIFRDAALTSPISIDSVEGRERFSMQMKVTDIDHGKLTRR